MNSAFLKAIKFSKCLVALAYLLNNVAYAYSSIEEEIASLESTVSGHVDGRLSTYGAIVEGNSSAYGLRESYISASVELQEQIRAVINLNLTHIFENESLELNVEFNIQQFIEEAYIEIREFNGKPFAIVLGKRPIKFGANVEQMPFYERNPLLSNMMIDNVFGFTFEVTEKIMDVIGLLNQIEFTVYESKQNDLKINEFGSFAVRGTKMLSKNFLLTLGYSNQINEGSENNQNRLNIGVVGSTKDGKILGWVEGVIFNYDPNNPDSNVGLTGGITALMTPTLSFILESTFINNSLFQIGIGVKKDFTPQLSLGVETRMTYRANADFEFFNGLVLTHTFDYSTQSTAETLLLEDEDDEIY